MLDGKINPGAHQVNEHDNRQQNNKEREQHQQGGREWFFPFVFAGQNKHGFLQENKQCIGTQQGWYEGL